jgi:signal transduction histidine kinase/ActR/RegA family two-component response regulator
MSSKVGTYGAKLAGGLLGGGLLAICVLAAALFLGAKTANEIALGAEQEQLANGVASRITELEGAIVPQVDWDDAVAHLDNRFDQAWAESNIGVFLIQTSGFQRAYVLNGADRPVFAHDSAQTLPPHRYSEFAAPAATLVQHVRTLEAQRGPIRIVKASKNMVSAPIQASTVVRLGEQPWILTASLVQPDFGTARPSARAPIVITGRRVDPHFVAELAKRYLLKDARIAAVGEPRAHGVAEAQFNDRTGRPVAALRWTPRRPGAELIHRIIWPLILALLLLVLVIVCLHRAAMRSLSGLLRTQDELREAARRAEASERAKSEFLANMSHEIRTPLNGVIGVAELLARSKLNDDQKDLVETIRASGKMLDRLLLDVLEVSKMEAGQLGVCHEPFSVADEVRTVAALWRPKAEALGLCFTCEVDPAAAAAVMGDAVRLRQILSNLVSNAVKFTAEGDVALRVVRHGDTYRFSVDDTGIGFDEETKAKLFARFEQGDNSITRRFGGSGLGLSISRSLAELMDGRLDAEGAPGLGATFVLELPLPPAAATADRTAPEVDEAAPMGLRVLAVDDHATNRKVVRLVLEMMDSEITLANDGVEALQCYEAARFDLILMDMQMPNLDGLEATREIRRREAATGRPRTPIIMLTANAGDEHVVKAIQAGADGHVTKPLNPEVLVRSICAVRKAPAAVAAA